VEFSIGRSALLDALGEALGVQARGKTAFLGRFQHLQRLHLVQGINPGRGKSAEYQAFQMLVIALAMQMLQLGLPPERVVRLLHDNRQTVERSLIEAVPTPDDLAPSVIFYDPAVLSVLGDGAEAVPFVDQTFDCAGAETLSAMIEQFVVNGVVPRLALINVAGTISAIKDALWDFPCDRDGEGASLPEQGAASALFHISLHDWAVDCGMG